MYMKHHKIFSVIAFAGLLNITCTQLNAQQGRVDSIARQLNQSFINNKLDTNRFDTAIYLLSTTSLTGSQINQIETAVAGHKNQENSKIRLEIFKAILKTDANKTIDYGKLQIEKLDKFNSPEISNIKRQYLMQLRLPFRNTNRLEEGFQYYTPKLNDYSTSNDSLGISTFYNVLIGF